MDMGPHTAKVSWTRKSWTRKFNARMVSVVCTGVILAACAGQTTEPSPEICRTADCFAKQTQKELREQCHRDLTRYPRSRSARKVVDAKYRYPFTDAKTYYAWVRYGGSGPSPFEWCKHYAKQVSVVAYNR